MIQYLHTVKVNCESTERYGHQYETELSFISKKIDLSNFKGDIITQNNFEDFFTDIYKLLTSVNINFLCEFPIMETSLFSNYIYYCFPHKIYYLVNEISFIDNNNFSFYLLNIFVGTFIRANK